MQEPYAIGTARTTAGSAIVTGTGTGWLLALASGGLFTRAGFAVPIVSVESDTSLTLAYPWPGTTATSAYAIDLGRAEAASAIAANRRLAELVAGLNAMSTIGAELANAADAQAALVALGLSTFARTLLDDADASAALSTLGVSDFIKTLLEDADQAAACATLGAQPAGSYQEALGFLPVQQGGGTGQLTNKVRLGWSGTFLKAQVDGDDQGRIWTDREASRSLGQNGYQRLPSGFIIQWGRSANAVAEYRIPYSIAFPNACLNAEATTYGNYGATVIYSAYVDDAQASSFAVRKRSVLNGGSVQATSDAFLISWFAIGY